MKLYELTETYEKALTELVDAETGEINEDSMKALQEIQGSINEKGLAVAMFIQNRNADIDAIKSEERRLAGMRKSLEKRNEWLKNYLKENMSACGISEITSPIFKIKLKKCPPSVTVFDENQIPNQYLKVVETISIDKNMIKQDIQNGIDVAGAKLDQNLTVSIK